MADVKMARYQDRVTGSVVNVDEETAAQLGPTYEPAKSSSKSSK